MYRRGYEIRSVRRRGNMEHPRNRGNLLAGIFFASLMLIIAYAMTHPVGF